MAKYHNFQKNLQNDRKAGFSRARPAPVTLLIRGRPDKKIVRRSLIQTTYQ
jgi:hypothetical protein